jgi:hypothetical protein
MEQLGLKHGVRNSVVPQKGVNVTKDYRIEVEFESKPKISRAYRFIFAENEQDARVEFSKEYGAYFRKEHIQFKILAVDEIDPATITSRLEGPHLATIPALQRLPSETLIIRPADSPACEWGWGRRVWRDAEGLYVMDKLKVVGCRGYMEDPPQGGPYHLVEVADGSIGLYLCQEHLEDTFPQWKKLPKGATRSHTRGQRRGQ